MIDTAKKRGAYVKACDKCGETRNAFIFGRPTCVICEAAADSVKDDHSASRTSYRPPTAQEFIVSNLRERYGAPVFYGKPDELQKLLEFTASAFSVTVQDIVTDSRIAWKVAPRRWFFWAARILTRATCQALADFLGRDHSTVYHAIKTAHDANNENQQHEMFNVALLQLARKELEGMTHVGISGKLSVGAVLPCASDVHLGGA